MAANPKAGLRVRDLRLRHVAQDIGLAPASGAWTMPAKRLELDVGFLAVVPGNGPFIPDHLEIARRESHEAPNILPRPDAVKIRRLYFTNPQCGKNGQYTNSPRPIKFSCGTVPQYRLSNELYELSPIAKYFPAGTVNVASGEVR